jgi:hypothetical protein
MRRWSKIGTVMTTLLLCSLIAAGPVLAGSAPVGGARPAAISKATGSDQIVAAQAIPASFTEVTAAFTASPTTEGLGEALAASRATFSSTETIEFNGVLFVSGLAGTSADLALYLFDIRGRLAAGPFLLNDVSAPDDRTDFFIQMNAASLLVTGRFNWVMTISDAFGGFIVTGLHGIEIQ